MKTMLLTPSPAIAAIVLLTCHTIAQQTIQVPQQQPTIEAAIAAAADGDRIQLTQSNYAIGVNGLTLAKSLVVETVGSARATISYPDIPFGGPVTPGFPALRITGFGTGTRIVLRNVTFDGGYSPWAWSPPRSAVIDVQLPNDTRHFSGDGDLHLHGLEDHDVVAFGDELPFVDQHLPHVRRNLGADLVHGPKRTGDRDFARSDPAIRGVCSIRLRTCGFCC